MIQNQITNHFNQASERSQPREKKSFWASDVEKNRFDLFHAWKSTPYTNPIDPEKLLMFEAGKAIEMAYVDVLKEAGVLVEPEGEQHRIEIEREGITVSGKMDAVVVLPESGNIRMPVEVKTFYGDYQERELLSGKPKTSYLKQLAVYMDAMGVHLGVLFYVHRGTGKVYEFYLKRREGTLQFYMDNGIEFDLSEEYKRFSELYHNHIVPGIEPDSDYVYKTPIEDIDWKKIPKYKITKARNNHAVIGDWQVLYSPYKHLILAQEGTDLGYTPDEVEQIKAATKGYSKW